MPFGFNVFAESCVAFFSFFCFHVFQGGDKIYCSWDKCHCSGTVHVLFMGPTAILFRKKIKNGSHGNIHTFKNYFVTVFSVSVFSFSKNKFNPNTPYLYFK